MVFFGGLEWSGERPDLLDKIKQKDLRFPPASEKWVMTFYGYSVDLISLDEENYPVPDCLGFPNDGSQIQYGAQYIGYPALLGSGKGDFD